MQARRASKRRVAVGVEGLQSGQTILGGKGARVHGQQERSAGSVVEVAEASFLFLFIQGTAGLQDALVFV